MDNSPTEEQLANCRRGWNTYREVSYWIPPSDIEGEIPSDLHGTLFRNGPGLTEVYGTKFEHPIDSDGMVCAVTFLNGCVHFKSKFVVTKHREEESDQQTFLYPGQMGTRKGSIIKDTIMTSLSFITGKFPKLVFRNPSNTNVFYWGGKLLTCYETSLPYCLDPSSLNTLGEDNLGGTLKLGTLGAHFRVDPVNKRLVTISVKPGASRPPSLGIYEFEENWDIYQSQVQHIKGLNYSHDFLLLPNYYVFHMTPFVNATWWIAFKIFCGFTSPGSMVKYYPELPSRFVIIPRDPERSADIVQVDTEPFHIYHFGTAEEDGETIKFCAVCMGPKFNMDFDSGLTLGNISVAPGHVYNFEIDLKNRKCSSQKGDAASVEFPTTHPYRHGLKGTKYSYLMANDRDGCSIPYRDIVKYDTHGVSRQVWYSQGVIGEPVFVPRSGFESSNTGDEDDGFVLVQMYDVGQHKTTFCILDAKNINRGPIARIKLKHHVPYGFHGTFWPKVFETAPLCMKNSKL